MAAIVGRPAPAEPAPLLDITKGNLATCSTNKDVSIFYIAKRQDCREKNKRVYTALLTLAKPFVNSLAGLEKAKNEFKLAFLYKSSVDQKMHFALSDKFDPKVTVGSGLLHVILLGKQPIDSSMFITEKMHDDQYNRWAAYCDKTKFV